MTTLETPPARRFDPEVGTYQPSDFGLSETRPNSPDWTVITIAVGLGLMAFAYLLARAS